MKTIPHAWGLLAATLGLAGCYLPLSSKVESEREIGRRSAPEAVILHRVVRQHIISPLEPLSDEKIGHNYLVRHQYFLRRGDTEQRLEFLEVGFRGFTDPKKRVEEVEQRVLPIAGTTSWIAVRAVKVHRPYVDLEIIVFDDDLRQRLTVLEGVHRQRPVLSRAYLVGLNYIDSLRLENGNRQVVYQTDKGRFALDPLTFAVTRR